MGDSLRVDSDLAEALVNELAALADAAQQDLTRLKDTLHQEGACWGNDEPGRVIGDTYEPEAKKGLTGFQNLVDNIRGLSDGIAGVTKTFDNQDQEIGRQINAIGQNGIGSDGLPSTSPLVEQPVAQNGLVPQSVPSSYAPQSNTNGSTASPGSADAPVTSGQPGYQPYGNPGAPRQPGSPDYEPVDGSRTPDGLQVDPGAVAPQAVHGSPPRAVQGATPQPGRDTATPATATPTAGARPATTGGAGTPWSSRQSRTPSPRSVAGTPWSGPGSGAPGQAIPPHPTGPPPRAAKPAQLHRDSKARKPKRVSAKPTRVEVETDGAAMAAARTLAARHDLHVVGFDTSGIAETTVHEIAAAIDNILGHYPFLNLGGIEIAELGGGEISRVAWDRPVGEPDGAKTAPWIQLDRAAAVNPAKVAEILSAAGQSGVSISGSEEQPMYSIIVADLGRILEALAGRQPRQLAQRSLIAEYRRISGPWSGAEPLARVVRGYRQWRSQLSGRSIIRGRFHPREALVVAFAEVELCGEGACGPAKVLHRLVVESARTRSSAS
ncbi:hypothetical protein AB4305_19115 [Nocardia sp. 2YAB30]|uniref:hypothetical protein n=1 Tax=unclassified Nocardia TaxID=2637762 RepID=UPI003F9B2263